MMKKLKDLLSCDDSLPNIIDATTQTDNNTTNDTLSQSQSQLRNKYKFQLRFTNYDNPNNYNIKKAKKKELSSKILKIQQYKIQIPTANGIKITRREKIITGTET